MKRALPLLALITACGGSKPQSAPTLEEPPVGATSTVDRTGLPTPGRTPDWDPPAPTRWKLDNGIEVWLLRQSQIPLVSVRLIVPRGSATDPVGKAGMTALGIDMLDEGAGGRSALELSEQLQRLATDFDSSVDTDATVLSMNMLADKFGDSVQLLSDLVRKPAFPPEEFERRKAQHLAGAIAAEADPGTARGVVLRRVLYGEGYGGFPAGGTRDTLAKLELAAVKAHVGKTLSPEGAAFVVVGDVERDAVEKALAAHFGGWKAAPGVKPAAVAERKHEPAIYLIDYPGTSQASLTVARRAPGMMQADDYFEAMVFNWSLGGAFSSRLNLNLREDKGYTYGARAGFNRWREAGFYYLAANVKIENTKDALTEMFGELSALSGAKPLTAKERDEAVSGLLLGLPGDFEGMEDVAGQFAQLPIFQRPEDWFAKFPDRIQAVTLAQADAAAKKYATGDYVVVVAGDAKVLEPMLADPARPIRRYDPRGNPVK